MLFFLKHDELLLLVLSLHPVERASELAHEAFEDVQGDVVVAQHADGAGLLQGVEHVLRRIRLREDAGGDLDSAVLAVDGIRGAVGAEEEFRVAGRGGAQKGVAVGLGLSDGLAEAEGIETVIDDHEEMVPATVGPHFLATSMAVAVVRCSRTSRRAGNRLCSSRNVGMKHSSADMTGMSPIEGHSPCRFKIMSGRCISSNTG